MILPVRPHGDKENEDEMPDARRDGLSTIHQQSELPRQATSLLARTHPIAERCAAKCGNSHLQCCRDIGHAGAHEAMNIDITTWRDGDVETPKPTSKVLTAVERVAVDRVDFVLELMEALDDPAKAAAIEHLMQEWREG